MKKSLLLITALLVFSICFSIVAYGGDHDTPIIPITNTSNVTGSEGDGTGDNGEPSGGVEVSKKETTDESSSSDGGWELPTELIDQTVSIKKCTVSSIKNRVYTGKAIKPAVTVKNGSTTLKSGVDYTLSYKNNTKIGVATVTIKGKGNYKDSVNVTFKIVPKSTALSKLTTPKKKQLKVTWKKQTTQTTGSSYQLLG